MRVTMSRWSCVALLLAGCRAGLEIQISLDGEVVGKAFDAADVGDRAALLARARAILAELGGNKPPGVVLPLRHGWASRGGEAATVTRSRV